MPLELVAPEEQIIRKKEEKPVIKPKPQKPPKEPKEIPMISLEKREIRRGIPIIPGDPCCAKLCEILNHKIDRKKELLSSTITLGGGRGIYKSATYRSLIYQIETLESHRQDLKDKGKCGCIEETGAVSIIVPLIHAQQPREEIPETQLIGMRLIAPPPKKLKEIYQKEKSIIPPTNSCCPDTCQMLNNEIEKTREILDNMELRGGSEVVKNPRYEALSAKTFALQDYRTELKNKGSCRCVQ